VGTFNVVVRIRMKILPVLGKVAGARAVVRGAAIAGRGRVTDVAKVLVLGRPARGRIESPRTVVFCAGTIQVVPDQVLNHVDAIRVQDGHHAQVGILGSE